MPTVVMETKMVTPALTPMCTAQRLMMDATHPPLLGALCLSMSSLRPITITRPVTTMNLKKLWM